MKYSLLKIIICLIILLILTTDCVSIAKVTDFPKGYKNINFEKLSNEYVEEQTPFWTLESSNEYYFEKPIILPSTRLILLMSEALTNNGYRVVIADSLDQVVIGKRGLRANEWNTITGIYYQLNPSHQITQIYVTSKITQDITGGYRNNRAKKVGSELEGLVSNNGQY